MQYLNAKTIGKEANKAIDSIFFHLMEDDILPEKITSPIGEIILGDKEYKFYIIVSLQGDTTPTKDERGG